MRYLLARRVSLAGMNAHRDSEADQPDAHGQGKRHDFGMSRSICAENGMIHRLLPLWHPKMKVIRSFRFGTA